MLGFFSPKLFEDLNIEMATFWFLSLRILTLWQPETLQTANQC